MKMNIQFTRAGFFGLALVLLLVLGGCENPSSGSDDDTTTITNAAREAADSFYVDHSAVLELPEAMLTLGRGIPVDAALAAYNALDVETKTLLVKEKTHLDSLKTKLEGLRAAAEQGVYYTTTDLEAWLAEQPNNTLDDPYTVVYNGSETAKTLYKTLGVAGKYVVLDLSESGVQGFITGDEEGRDLIVSLILPDSLIEIPNGTSGGPIFAGFTNLKTVNAAGVVNIGAYAFRDCTALSMITLPKAETIATGAFYQCINLTLTATNLPEAVSIGASAFYGCTNLTSVTLPKAASIGNYAFQGCIRLASITLLKATSIGVSAFYGCTGFGTLTLGPIPPDVTATARIFTSIAESAKTITIKTRYLGLYTNAGTPWSDKVNMTNTSAGNFWDNTTTTRGNLTVNLASL
jgi:hypothetical protein